ncbi:NO-inducible flavohemoprotein [Hymenobacter terrenus]|uniref:NO-inducible flavohemoprotein n=1 Tax=Hymenobacter terrenus TaxID=1629124 RepID=UPI000619A504|nr:NO-inducible flavohemoprotein [Hymenobacter terrenus]
MEQAQIIALLHQTAPALVSNGDQLTRAFYQHLFAQHPELQHTFNMANQTSGKQARSLFDAIVLFVTKFDQLETLGPDARRIAAKHTSLDIQPEHYPLVGASLLATIRDTLGPAATPDVMLAWELAYGRIAQVLMGVEAATYEQQQTQPGGWRGFKPFVVAEVAVECEGIRSFYLVPAHGQDLPTYQPGQFISVSVQLPDHPFRQLRQYSLSDAPGKPYYRITVKREEERPGLAPAGLISNYLHATLNAGDTLMVHAPSGEFYLDTAAQTPVVLLAGGVGITPLMAMTEHSLQTNPTRRLVLIHAVRDARNQAFSARLAALAAAHPSFRTFTLFGAPNAQPAWPGPFAIGLLSTEHLDTWLGAEDEPADYYCCGPTGFMQHVQQLLKARGVANCHFEVFGPTQAEQLR